MNENEKESFSEKLENFFAGKGFYIVLFLCVAVIGVSAWIMLSGTGADVDVRSDEDVTVAVRPVAPTTATPGRGENGPESSVPTSESAERFSDSQSAYAEAEGAFAGSPEGYEPAAETFAEQEPSGAETSTESFPVPAMAEEGETAQTESAATPQAEFFVWPVNGPVEVPYAVETLRYDRTMLDWRCHEGMDLGAPLGTQVMAAAAGQVVSVRQDPLYGCTVEIDHGGGLKSVYSNLAALPTVNEGDGVTAGEVIGAVGDTALCETGETSHLHFAMSLDGRSVDPEDYLP